MKKVFLLFLCLLMIFSAGCSNIGLSSESETAASRPDPVKKYFKLQENADGTYDFENIFRYSKDLVSSVDYAIANLETTFGGPKHPHQPNMAFCCPDELAANAASAGYDMFLTCNNHTGDAMGDGLIRTLEVTREAGLVTLGSQMPGEKRYSVVEVNGIKIGMVAYTWAFKDNGGSFSLNGLNPIKDEGQMNYFTKANPDKLYKEVEPMIAEMKAEGAEANTPVPKTASRERMVRLVRPEQDANALSPMDSMPSPISTVFRPKQ